MLAFVEVASAVYYELGLYNTKDLMWRKYVKQWGGLIPLNLQVVCWIDSTILLMSC